jgi:hypothetical protein
MFCSLLNSVYLFLTLFLSSCQRLPRGVYVCFTSRYHGVVLIKHSFSLHYPFFVPVYLSSLFPSFPANAVNHQSTSHMFCTFETGHLLCNHLFSNPLLFSHCHRTGLLNTGTYVEARLTWPFCHMNTASCDRSTEQTSIVGLVYEMTARCSGDKW